MRDVSAVVPCQSADITSPLGDGISDHARELQIRRGQIASIGFEIGETRSGTKREVVIAPFAGDGQRIAILAFGRFGVSEFPMTRTTSERRCAAEQCVLA